MTNFEQWTFGVGKDSSTNWAPTAGQILISFVFDQKFQKLSFWKVFKKHY